MPKGKNPIMTALEPTSCIFKQNQANRQTVSPQKFRFYSKCWGFNNYRLPRQREPKKTPTFAKEPKFSERNNRAVCKTGGYFFLCIMEIIGRTGDDLTALTAIADENAEITPEDC